MSSGDGTPFGTGPRIFGCIRNILYVTMLSETGAQNLGFVYEDDTQARSAAHSLQKQLFSKQDFLSSQLRKKYCLLNLHTFLEQYLPREGICSLQFETLIELSPQGLNYVRPDGLRTSLHVEDVLLSTMNWEKVDRNSQVPTVAARYAYRHFRLPLGWIWTSHARINRADGWELLFEME